MKTFGWCNAFQIEQRVLWVDEIIVIVGNNGARHSQDERNFSGYPFVTNTLCGFWRGKVPVRWDGFTVPVVRHSGVREVTRFVLFKGKTDDPEALETFNRKRVDEPLERGKGDRARGINEVGAGTVPPPATSSGTAAAESIVRIVVRLAAKPVNLQT